MKNDKFCVSKSLAYLVALVVAVVGAFYAMNYVNSQKLTSNSNAAGEGTCTWASVASYPGGCGETSNGKRGFSTAMNTKFTEDDTRNKENDQGQVTIRCCVGQKGQVQQNAGTQTCKQKGGSDWYSDSTATALQTRLNKNVPAGGTTARVVQVLGPFSDTQTGKKCYKITYNYSNSGTQTCKQKGGSDWYSDTSAAKLQERLNKDVPAGGTTAAVTEVAGPFSDTRLGRKCYTIRYNYAANPNAGATGSCNDAGGQWFRDQTATALDNRLTVADSNTEVTVTDLTSEGPFTDGRVGQKCYEVRYTAAASATCSAQGGKWYGYDTCALAEKDWDPNGTTSEKISAPTFTWNDTRTGSSCCVVKY